MRRPREKRPRAHREMAIGVAVGTDVHSRDGPSVLDHVDPFNVAGRVDLPDDDALPLAAGQFDIGEPRRLRTATHRTE